MYIREEKNQNKGKSIVGSLEELKGLTTADAEENKRLWREVYWPSFQKTKADTDDKIDKKVYGISIGGLGFELACLQFIRYIPNRWLAIFPAALFTISLMLNLLSQYKALELHEKVEEALNGYLKSRGDNDSFIYNLIEKANKNIKRIITASIITMIIAIIFLIIFFLLSL